MDSNSRERHRIKERIPCNIELVIDDALVCEAFDISEGGVYLHTTHSFNPGSTVKVSLQSINENIEVMARVKHCQEGFGMGLMFIDLDDVMKTKIRLLVNAIKKLTP